MLKQNSIEKIEKLIPEIDYPCLLKIFGDKLKLNNAYILAIYYVDEIFYELENIKEAEIEFCDYYKGNGYIPVNYIDIPYLLINDKLSENESVVISTTIHMYPVIITRAFVEKDINNLKKLIEGYLLSVLTPRIKDFKQIEQTVSELGIDLNQELDAYEISQLYEEYEDFERYYIYPMMIKLRDSIINELKDKNYDYIVLLYHED